MAFAARLLEPFARAAEQLRKKKRANLVGRLTYWIKSHQVTAFFIITFAITWGLGFSYSAAQIKGMVWLYPVASLATCGPAVAGIIITAVTNTQPRQGSCRTRWIAFLVAWVVSALVWLAYITSNNGAPFSPALVVLALVTVLPVAFVIGMAFSRIPAVKSYLASLVRLRGVWGWALLAFLFYPALILLSIPVSRLLGRQPITNYQLLAAGLPLTGLIASRFFYQFFFYNAIGEEVGWRGFAMPRLQRHTSPLIASLILACFWAPWHLFLWQSQRQAVMTLNFWIANSSLIVLSSIITGWFYNRSQGSILVAGIVHAAENTNARLFLILDWNGYLVLKAVVALVIILAGRMWKRLPSDHPAVYRDPVLAAQD